MYFYLSVHNSSAWFELSTLSILEDSFCTTSWILTWISCARNRSLKFAWPVCMMLLILKTVNYVYKMAVRRWIRAFSKYTQMNKKLNNEKSRRLRHSAHSEWQKMTFFIHFDHIQTISINNYRLNTQPENTTKQYIKPRCSMFPL